MSKKPDNNKKYGWLTAHQTKKIQQDRNEVDNFVKKNTGIELFLL
jgi:hypothetical protein